eukprot:Rhum_TRINITY_DN14932_c33_g1::Rhum_TRINITY_DN14932_c33_g1_i1::g.129858::m.129858
MSNTKTMLREWGGGEGEKRRSGVVDHTPHHHCSPVAPPPLPTGTPTPSSHRVRDEGGSQLARLQRRDLRDAVGVAATLKLGGEEGRHHFLVHLGSGGARTHAHDVRVVVVAAHARRVRLVAQCRTDAVELVRRDRHANTRSADQDTPSSRLRHLGAHSARNIRVVHPVRTRHPAVHHLPALLLNELRHQRLLLPRRVVAPEHQRLRRLRRRRRQRGLRRHDLAHTPLVAPALKARRQERLQHLRDDVRTGGARTHAEHVGVVVAAAHGRRVVVVAEGGADAVDLAGGDRHADAAAAEQDTAAALRGLGHLGAHLGGLVRVVDAVAGVRAAVHDLNALGGGRLQKLHDARTRRHGGVVARNDNAGERRHLNRSGAFSSNEVQIL